jgi:CBS domain-containing protein
VFDLAVKYVMEAKKIVTASPDTLVSRAAELMLERGVGAVMVLEADSLVGIFTERDAVFRVIAVGLDPCATKLSQVMTSSPRTITSDKPFGHALFIMHENKFRHVPVVDNGRVVGVVSARNALDPDLEEFVSEAHRREHYRP